MVIIQLYKELDTITSNNLRIENIEKTQKGNLQTLFKCLKHSLKAEDRGKIKWFLQEVVFFEEIPDECIDQLIEAFNKVQDEKIIMFIDMLRESYALRGTRGYRFTFTPILRRVG